MMADEEKKARTARKSALTRELNTIRKLMVEDERDDVKGRITGLKEKFKAFEYAHDRYHNKIEETLHEESDAYYDEVCNNYIDVFTSIKSWIADFDKKEFKGKEKEHISPTDF